MSEPMTTKEIINELMCCEHMGDVTGVTRKIAASVGLSLTGIHGEWETEDWDALDALLEAGSK